MKKATLIFKIFICLNASIAFSQAPQSFKYQAVARDNSGSPLVNQNVSFRISVLSGSSTGTSVYSETQNKTTNQFGLANLNIGAGTIVSGNFSNIDWGTNSYFVKIEFDASAGSNYVLMGTSQLLSVPYALYAEKAKTTATDATSLYYPDGLENITPVTIDLSTSTYLVPSGKNLYIKQVSNPRRVVPTSSWTAHVGNNYIKINNVPEWVGKENPVIAGENSVISSDSINIINGFLINKIISPVNVPFNTIYTVPSGKTLVAFPGVDNYTVEIDGITFYLKTLVTSGDYYYNKAPSNTFFLNAGQTIKTENSLCGYLK